MKIALVLSAIKGTFRKGVNVLFVPRTGTVTGAHKTQGRRSHGLGEGEQDPSSSERGPQMPGATNAPRPDVPVRQEPRP